MNRIDKNTELEAKRKEYQPLAKEIMDKVRNNTVTQKELIEFVTKLQNAGIAGDMTVNTLMRLAISSNNAEYYPTMDGELTQEQRESKIPIGTKGYYRMYRWECLQCSAHGKKMPYSEMQTDAIKHHEKTGHKMKERGGVFPKEDLYT